MFLHGEVDWSIGFCYPTIIIWCVRLLLRLAHDSASPFPPSVAGSSQVVVTVIVLILVKFYFAKSIMLLRTYW